MYSQVAGLRMRFLLPILRKLLTVDLTQKRRDKHLANQYLTILLTTTEACSRLLKGGSSLLFTTHSFLQKQAAVVSIELSNKIDFQQQLEF